MTSPAETEAQLPTVATPPDRRCSACRVERKWHEFADRRSKVCNLCAGSSVAAIALKDRLRLAGDAFRAIIDSAQTPQLKSAPRMNDMLAIFFEQWGGEQQFVRDLVRHGKNMLETKPLSPDTTRYMTGMLKLVNENNRREDDLNVKRMSDEELRQAKQMALLEMLMDAEFDEAKAKLLEGVLQAFNLPKTEQFAAEVQVVQQ